MHDLKKKMDGLEKSVEVIPDTDIYKSRALGFTRFVSDRFRCGILKLGQLVDMETRIVDTWKKHSDQFNTIFQHLKLPILLCFPDKSPVKSDTERFFFCKRYPHGVQMGFWKATGKDRHVKSSSQVIGTKRTLVFHIGRAPKAERTEWIMYEYCMKDEPLVKLQLQKMGGPKF